MVCPAVCPTVLQGCRTVRYSVPWLRQAWTDVTNMTDPSKIEAYPEDGMYIHGCCMEVHCAGALPQLTTPWASRESPRGSDYTYLQPAGHAPDELGEGPWRVPPWLYTARRLQLSALRLAGCAMGYEEGSNCRKLAEGNLAPMSTARVPHVCCVGSIHK